MRVWTAPVVPSALAALSQMAPAPRDCDEHALVTDARAVLRNHFDVELGAVAPGSSARVGFQYLKTADALLAAQAIAHDDFGRAADQFRHIVSHQHHDGSLPLIVYGPSVDVASRWIDSEKTFYPGPALWLQANDSTANSDSTSDSASTSNDNDHSNDADHNGSRLATASLLAPPIAADVALQMYRLSPYETTMGVVGHTTDAVRFLCEVYPVLRTMHHYLFTSRQPSNGTALLAAHHPWETFSPFSRHWLRSLDHVKSLPGYDMFVQEIPSSAKSRFADGAILEGSSTDAVTSFYEPMMFLASCYNRSSHGESDGSSCRLNVFDVEFNALALRSADAFVDINRVLVALSSSCPSFKFEVSDLLDELETASTQAALLRDAITGNETTPSRLWNATAQIFNDEVSNSTTPPQDGSPSLRGIMPAYSIHLSEDKMMGILSHFLRSSDTFQFLCARYPTSFFPCDSSPTDEKVTLLHHNYYLQQAFTKNEFPGLSMYLRNMTRALVCTSSSGNATALAYRSDSGHTIDTFEDGFTGSSLAAALLINILLPAVTSPPSPDALPVDHRMLTVIMCVELVVAFGVALGCVFLSVYFVVNRPRDKRSTRTITDSARARKRREGRSHRSEGVGVVSSGNESQSSFGSSLDLEEGLLSEEEDPAYGSFNDRQGHSRSNGAETPGGTWHALKEALASISPW